MHYNLIKSSNRKYLEEIKHRGHEMPKFYDAVNILQKTEWLVNEEVFQIFKHCFDNNIPLGNLPVNPDTIEFPPKPFDIATNLDARIKWKKQAKPIHHLKFKAESKFLQVKQIKTIVELYRTLGGGFFFPQQSDFRGRLYPVPAMFEPQSADYSRALMKFKWGKKMGSLENVKIFKVYGTNLFGEADKETIENRIKWVDDNMEQILSTARNPLEDTYWSKADKPFTFLAWSFELRDFIDAGESLEFITTLPIQADCSNSGLQHYSAMMRDPIGAKATNLIPSNKPNDVYREVAEKVVEKLSTKVNQLLADQWLKYGINRKLTKKPVMCLPYGLKRFSCRKYIEEFIQKELQEKGVQHPFKADLFKATQYLTPIVWEAIGDVVVGARQVMKFLQDVSRLVASENLPVSWTSPLGLPIQMWNYETESKRVNTKMGDSVIKQTVKNETDKISKRKTVQSVAPNFIHSCDAAVMMLAITKARELHIENFSMIHDSFGVLAPDYETMGKCIREAFCEIYEKDVLAEWAREMYQMLSPKNQRKFPPMPAKGNLDLAQVKNSVFFCI